jgi:hypothetical protein
MRSDEENSMHAFLGIALLIAIVFGILGLLLSLLTSDWTWFARAGSIMTAEAIWLFAFFEEKFAFYAREAQNLFRQVGGLAQPKNDNEVRFLEFIRARGLMDDVAQDPQKAWEMFQPYLSALRTQAIAIEKVLAIVGTLIWGFGDLPQKLY